VEVLSEVRFLGNGARPSLFHFPAAATLLAGPPLAAPPPVAGPQRHPARPGQLLAGCSPVRHACCSPRARPSRSPPPPRPARPPAARSPRHRRLLGRPDTAGCSAASLPPATRAPRRSRLLGRPATAARRVTVSSIQVTTSECLYFIFLLNILTSESQLILNRRKLCQLG
jgi:hypothetical protein